MTTSERDPVLVIVQLVGGNDFMNTVIPYTNPLYHDARPGLAFSQEEVLPIDDTLAFNPHAAPLKDMYDAGKMAVVQGVGYPNSSRSHFRSTYIWHTCEPDTIVTEGWLGTGHRRDGPRQGELPDWSQLRARPATVLRVQGRSGHVGSRLGQLRADDQHHRSGSPAIVSGAVQEDVRAGGGHGACNGLPLGDGSRGAQRRR